MAFGKFFRTSHVQDDRAFSTMFAEVRDVHFLKTASLASSSSGGLGLFSACETNGVGEIGGFTAAPVMKENIARILVRHVLMDGHDVDLALAKRTKHRL